MENTLLAADKKDVHCPYNPAHCMPQKTLPLHLTKCRDRRLHYQTCSFNNTHVMPYNEIEAHERQCPFRIALDQIMFESADDVRPITVIDKQPTVICDESWDEPVSYTSVVNSINQRPNFMKPTYGLSKGERKKQRNQLRNTYADVDLSYNPDLSIHKRQDASLSNSNTKAISGLPQHQDGEKNKFFGRRPCN